MLVNLKPLIDFAAENSAAVASINIFGIEDAMAAIEAAEAKERPVILGAAKDLIDFIPLEVIGPMLRKMAELSNTKICLHLDHCYDKNIIKKALDSGFTSVMFDGSQLPLEENIRQTSQIVDLAKKYDASVEGEIGSVAYVSGRAHIKNELTDPDEAFRFYTETGVDVTAVSVGNLHRLESKNSSINFDILEQIKKKVRVPICIHGTSGIPDNEIHKLATQTDTMKFNVATLFRMEWGNRLRILMNQEPEEYDRIFFMRKLQPFMVSRIQSFISLLG